MARYFRSNLLGAVLSRKNIKRDIKRQLRFTVRKETRNGPHPFRVSSSPITRAHPGKINPSQLRHFPQVFLSRFTRLLDNTDIHLRLRSTLTRIYRHILDRNTQFIALISLSPLPSPGRCYFQSLKKFVRLENSFPPSFLSFLLFFLPSFFPFFFFQFTLGPIVPDRETRSGPGGEGRREGAVTIEKSRKFRANLIYRRSHLRFATQLSFHPLTRRPRCREGIRGGQGWDPLDPCSFFRARIYYWFHRRHARGTAGWIRLIKNTLDSPLPLHSTLRDFHLDENRAEKNWRIFCRIFHEYLRPPSIITFHCSRIRPSSFPWNFSPLHPFSSQIIL